MITDNDLKALQLLESQGLSMDAKRIVKGIVFDGSLKGNDVLLGVLNGLDKGERLALLAENVVKFISTRNRGLVKYALDQGVDSNMMVDDWGVQRPLIFQAIEYGGADIVSLIIEANADLTVTSGTRTPLDYAKFCKNSVIIELIEKRISS